MIGRMTGRIVLVFVATVVLGQQAGHTSIPTFKDFPVDGPWRGTVPLLKLESPSERMFRTQFRMAAQKPANFAGHYRIAVWGCGTQCLAGGLVNLETGAVLPMPGTYPREDLKAWVFCNSAFGDSGIKTHLESRLLVLRCADAIGRDGGNYLHTRYFVLDEGTFKKIAETTGTRVFQLRCGFASCDATICHFPPRFITTSMYT
jgi:hypothetical protein